MSKHPVKKIYAHFSEKDGWRVGDKAVDLIDGSVYVLKFSHRGAINGYSYFIPIDYPFEKQSYVNRAFKLYQQSESCTKNELDTWTDWETCKSLRYHSAYHEKCEFMEHRFYDENGRYTKRFKIKIHIPKRVRMSDLAGTVLVDRFGKPDFSSYKEY